MITEIPKSLVKELKKARKQAHRDMKECGEPVLKGDLTTLSKIRKLCLKN